MPPHHRVRAWIAQNYRKPAVDQEWLSDCSDWLTSQLDLDPDRDFDDFIQHVEAQLLQSNLAHSTVPGSGIDPLLVASSPDAARPRPSRPARQPAPRQKKTTGPIPLLVEIKSITEIAHSALSLLNTHQTRIDRADLGLAPEENVEQHRDEDEGPIPKFPRGMLRFELSDGLTTFRAIEFRSLPQLELGTTTLGYKMFLNSTPIRNGIAFLEPANVTLKGYSTEDHDINSEQVFLSSLRKRLGRPDPPPEPPVAAQPRVNPPDQPPPAQPARRHQSPPVAQPQHPPADFDDMYIDDDVDPDVLREMAIQMDEMINIHDNRRVGGRAPPSDKPPAPKEKHPANLNPEQTMCLDTMSASSSLKTSSASSTVKTSTSPYFTPHSSESNLIPNIGLSPRLVPHPEDGFDITWDMDLPKPSKSPVKKPGATSARLPSTPSAKNVIPPEKRPASPDFFDDLSFDMDVDESFFEQVGMIEQGALGKGANNKGKGKAKDTGTEGTTSRGRSNVAPVRKTQPSGSVLGTKSLAPCPASSFGAEPSTRMQRRATSASSSVSGSTESLMPQSTQSSDRRLPRDPSFIIISSSEDEAPEAHRTARPLNLVGKRANKGKEIDHDEVADSDVINISD